MWLRSQTFQLYFLLYILYQLLITENQIQIRIWRMSSLTLRERRNSNKSNHDSMELYSLIDKCLQILQSDKLLLRQQVRNGCMELIQILNSNKRKSDLQPLQQQLRKYLNRVKAKNVTQPSGKENSYHSYQSSFASNTSSTSGQENRLSLNKDCKPPSSTSISKLQKKPYSKSNTRLINKSPLPNPKYSNESDKKFITTYKQFQQFKVKQEATQAQEIKPSVKVHLPPKQKTLQEKSIDSNDYIIPTFVTNVTQQSPQESVHRKEHSYLNFEFKNDQPEDSFFRNHSVKSIQQSNSLLNQSKSFLKDESISYKFFNQEESPQKKEKSEEEKNESNILIQSEQIINRNDLVLASFQDLANRFRIESKEESIQKSQKYETPKTQIPPFSKDDVQNSQHSQQDKIKGFQLGFQYDNLRKEDSLYQRENIQEEEDVMKKYASLFTSPDLLQQCKFAIKNYQSEASQRVSNECVDLPRSYEQGEKEREKSLQRSQQTALQDSVKESSDFRYFENRCLQVSARNGNKFEEFKFKAFSGEQAERIFDEIFSENSLNKISRAFFRFKMESLLQEEYDEQALGNEKLDELFESIDYRKDGFIDVNEMGRFLERVCRWENNEMKRAFNLLDREQQGAFSEQNVRDALGEVEAHGGFRGNREELSELGRIYFQECDIVLNGQLSYWEFYLKKTTPSGKKLVGVLKEYLALTQ